MMKLLAGVLLVVLLGVFFIVNSLLESRSLKRKSKPFVEKIMNQQGHLAQLRLILHYMMAYDLDHDEEPYDAEARILFRDSAFIYTIDRYYLQGWRDRNKLHCEIMGNKNFPDGEHLLSEKHGNYEILLECETRDDLDRLMDLLDRTIQIYGMSKDSTTQLRMVF